jgi:citrate lyase subunit beta / citryl-CoA lyase
MDVLYYPEARSADEVRVVQKALDLAGSEAEIAVLLETPESFLEIQALATVPRVTAFNHAQGDLSANLGVALTDTRETLLYTASQLVLVARAYGLLAIDTALPSNLRDAEISRRYIESSRRMGFQASSTFYAPHIDAINAVFSPSEQEVAEAREIVAEYERVRKEGRAAYVRPDGKWITVHQYRQAMTVLTQFG